MTLIVPQMAVYDAFPPYALRHVGPEGTMLLGCAAVPLPADWDDATHVWNATTRTMVPDLAKLKAKLSDAIRAENERRVEGLYSKNIGKQTKYVRKQQEARDYRGLAGTIAAQLITFNAMSAGEKTRRFRFAVAEAAARGVPVADVIATWETAITRDEGRLASWEAIERKIIMAIDLAPTPALARAAAALADWDWSGV